MGAHAARASRAARPPWRTSLLSWMTRQRTSTSCWAWWATHLPAQYMCDVRRELGAFVLTLASVHACSACTASVSLLLKSLTRALSMHCWVKASSDMQSRRRQPRLSGRSSARTTTRCAAATPTLRAAATTRNLQRKCVSSSTTSTRCGALL